MFSLSQSGLFGCLLILFARLLLDVCFAESYVGEGGSGRELNIFTDHSNHFESSILFSFFFLLWINRRWCLLHLFKTLPSVQILSLKGGGSLFCTCSSHGSSLRLSWLLDEMTDRLLIVRWGTVKGGRRRGRHRRGWEDNIIEWTSLEFAKSQRAVKNRKQIEETGREIICGAPNDPRG